MDDVPPIVDRKIVVRDPNQDNKDITEKIISEAGRSRKPTLPVGNVFSVPMPLQDKPELAFQQSDFDLEPVSTTVENSSVSPVIVEHLASAETPADEIEAQEAEPLNNEPEPSSEEESNDRVLSPVEEPNNNTMHKPEMENKRIQYSRDFLLSIQFMPDCMQKPEGLPPIPDVVLHKLSPLTSAECNLEAPPPCKFLLNVLMNEEVELKKAEDAWKPSMKRRNSTEDPETQKTEVNT